MREARAWWGVGIAVGCVLASSATPARAQQAAPGFRVERLYPSAPGGGWFVMNDLEMGGGLGGAAGLMTGYSRGALRIGDGGRRMAVVSDQAFADFAFAVSYERWRVYASFGTPLLLAGTGGSIGGYTFTAPSVDLGSHPDTLSDAQIGADVLLLGTAGSPFRLGASAQLYVPSGSRDDYDTDGTYRAMLRLLVAGDDGPLTYAAQVGVHIRPVDDAPVPGSPRGSELLFGAAAGARVPVGNDAWTVVVGPEIFGATALDAFGHTTETALEALLTGRFETAAHATGTVGVRVRAGGGAGLDQRFGAPEWRVVAGIEAFSR